MTTPLIEKTRINQIESVKSLIASGCDINEKDERGNTAIIDAVVCGYYEMAKLLLESGADVNCVDNHRHSALMMAAHTNNLECVKLLLEYGAVVNLKNLFGQTALDMAKEETVISKCFFFDTVTRPRRKESEVMKILKKYKKIQDKN